MNGYRPAFARGFRLTALVAAVICVLAVAAGAFVLSYPGVRDTALAAGVSAHLARFHPVVLDAVFVVACAAAVTLRGALRGYAWLALLIVAGAVAAAEATHAMSVTLPKRPLEATVAVIPWVALLVGLTLLYAMARQALPPRRTAVAGQVPANGSAPSAGRRAPSAGPLALTAGQAGAAGAGQPDAADKRAASTAVPLSSLLTDPGPAPAAARGTMTPAAGPDAPGSAVVTRPEPAPARSAPERDDPSDADAGPVDPAAHFTKPRSSPAPPTG